VIFPYTFSVGEIAVFLGEASDHPLRNHECTVVQSLHFVPQYYYAHGATWQTKPGGQMYGIQFSFSTETFVCFPENLRKRRPPTQEITRRVAEEFRVDV